MIHESAVLLTAWMAVTSYLLPLPMPRIRSFENGLNNTIAILTPPDVGG